MTEKNQCAGRVVKDKRVTEYERFRADNEAAAARYTSDARKLAVFDELLAAAEEMEHWFGRWPEWIPAYGDKTYKAGLAIKELQAAIAKAKGDKL